MKETEVTPHEFRVAMAMYETGGDNAEIASNLGVAPKTIATCLYTLYKKCGVRSDRNLLVWMRTNKLIPVDQNKKRYQQLRANILKLLAEGLTPEEVAARLKITTSTVIRHRR